MKDIRGASTLTIGQEAACYMLEDARDYLLRKTFNGDQGGDYMNYWDWNVVTCAALNILNEALSQIHLEANS